MGIDTSNKNATASPESKLHLNCTNSTSNTSIESDNHDLDKSSSSIPTMKGGIIPPAPLNNPSNPSIDFQFNDLDKSSSSIPTMKGGIIPPAPLNNPSNPSIDFQFNDLDKSPVTTQPSVEPGNVPTMNHSFHQPTQNTIVKQDQHMNQHQSVIPPVDDSVVNPPYLHKLNAFSQKPNSPVEQNTQSQIQYPGISVVCRVVGLPELLVCRSHHPQSM